MLNHKILLIFLALTILIGFTLFLPNSSNKTSLKISNTLQKQSNNQTKEIAFEIIDFGDHGWESLEPQQIILFNTADQLKSKWENLAQKPLDEINRKYNLDQKTLILTTLGERNTGGYSIRPSSIKQDQNGLLITYNETVPGKLCIVSLGTTNRWILIAIPKTDRPIKAEFTKEIIDCDKPIRAL